MAKLKLINQVENEILFAYGLKKAKLETLKAWLEMFGENDTFEYILEQSPDYKEQLEEYITILQENDLKLNDTQND